MNPSLINFRDQLVESVLRFLWRQWSALGVAGYAHSKDTWMVDPEALLLFSLPVARYDPRLFDEIMDWLHKNGALLSLNRLQTLEKEHQLGNPSLLRPVAESLAKSPGNSKWSLILKRFHPGNELGSPQALFVDVPVFAEPDDIFHRWGWVRGSLKGRGMSKAPRPDQPATFLFMLRALFGLQVRAEVMAWLLSHEHGHPAEIARQTGYFARSVHRVVTELEASGLVRSFRVGREKQFSLIHAQWRFLLQWTPADNFPVWIAWAPLFRALQTFIECLSQPGLDERSERFQSIQLREALLDSMPALIQAGKAHQLRSGPHLSGPELIDALRSDIETILS